MDRETIIQGRSGCYGKIPRLGDFITRSLDRSVVSLWDDWLQDGMAASRRKLGEDWLDFYTVAPVWNFAAGAGALGQSTWLGVMIPSVDRVGRYFPFTVMVDAGDCSPLAALYCWQSWFERAQALALECLEDDFDPDILEERLMTLPDADQVFDDRCDDEPWLALHDAGRHYSLGAEVSTREVLATIGSDALAEICPGFSLWWTQGSQHVAPCLLLERGLPSSQGFAALFDGDFQAAGWEQGRRVGAQANTEPDWDLAEESQDRGTS